MLARLLSLWCLLPRDSFTPAQIAIFQLVLVSVKTILAKKKKKKKKNCDFTFCVTCWLIINTSYEISNFFNILRIRDLCMNTYQFLFAEFPTFRIHKLLYEITNLN